MADDLVINVPRNRDVQLASCLAAAAQVAGQAGVQLQLPRVQTLVVRVVCFEACNSAERTNYDPALIVGRKKLVLP